MGALTANALKLLTLLEPDPTAMQVPSVTQETPVSVVVSDPPSGVFGTVDHAVPSQSATTLLEVDPVPDPTAVHDVMLMHATPPSVTGDVCGVLESIDHAVPFQVSMRPRLPVVGLNVFRPTALQKPCPAQDTDDSALPVPVVGAGVARTVQAEPFQISEKGAPAFELALPSPTAMHQVALTQSMPVASVTAGAPDASGVAAVWGDHEVPFHWKASTVVTLPGCAK